MNEQQDFSYIRRNLESIRARADAAAAASIPYVDRITYRVPAIWVHCPVIFPVIRK